MFYIGDNACLDCLLLDAVVFFLSDIVYIDAWYSELFAYESLSPPFDCSSTSTVESVNYF